jgi:glycosyltransferase involved in cell wall biosynthesis
MTRTSNPYYSIVIPVYNKEGFLSSAIKSVLTQQFSDFELILVLDPSTDKSEEEAYSFSDSRIRIFKRDVPGPGGYAARNLGIKHANAPWIAFLDADDTWSPDFLRVISKAIDENKLITVFTSGYSIKREGRLTSNTYFNKFSQVGSHSFSFEKFLRHKPIWTSVLVVRKDRILSCGGFPEGKYLRGGDQETWFRLMQQEREGFWINHLGAIYNTDADNMVTKNIRFNIANHPLFHTIQESITVEKDTALRLAMKRYWNLTAFNYFKNIAKRERIEFRDFLKYYFWNFKITDFQVILFFIYSWKNFLKRSKN